MVPPATQAPGQPLPKKRDPLLRGCLIAVGIMFALLLVVLILIGYGVWRVSSTVNGKKLVGTFAEGLRAAKESANAPGSAQLRLSGCAQASVVDLGRLMAMTAEMGAKVKKSGTSVFVICQLGPLAAEKTCDEVAATYVKAVGERALEPFMVSVQRQPGGTTLCSSSYDLLGQHAGPANLGAVDKADDAEPEAEEAEPEP